MTALPRANLYVVQLKYKCYQHAVTVGIPAATRVCALCQHHSAGRSGEGNGTGPGYDLFRRLAATTICCLLNQPAAKHEPSSAVYTDDDNDGLHRFKPGWIWARRFEDEQNGLPVLGRCRQLSVFLGGTTG